MISMGLTSGMTAPIPNGQMIGGAQFKFPRWGGGAASGATPGVSLGYRPTQYQIGSPQNAINLQAAALPTSAFTPAAAPVAKQTSFGQTPEMQRMLEGMLAKQKQRDMLGYANRESASGGSRASGSFGGRSGLY
jgi:hypothetical protein